MNERERTKGKARARTPKKRKGGRADDPATWTDGEIMRALARLCPEKYGASRARTCPKLAIPTTTRGPALRFLPNPP